MTIDKQHVSFVKDVKIGIEALNIMISISVIASVLHRFRNLKIMNCKDSTQRKKTCYSEKYIYLYVPNHNQFINKNQNYNGSLLYVGYMKSALYNYLLETDQNRLNEISDENRSQNRKGYRKVMLLHDNDRLHVT